MIEIATTVLKFLFGGSLVGFLGLYITWFTTSAEITVDGVASPSKKFNSESRLKIKNIGKLAAKNITFDVSELQVVVATNSISGKLSGFKGIPKLTGGESEEITSMLGFHFGSGMQVDQCSYLLTAQYDAKLLFMGGRRTKQWRVELRNFEDGFNWAVASI